MAAGSSRFWLCLVAVGLAGMLAAAGSIAKNPGIRGDASSETLHGTPGNDLIFGAGGDDIVHGAGGDDFLDEAEDRLKGARKNPGDNVLRGEAGDDLLRGGLGSDRLIGGVGDDTLVEYGTIHGQGRNAHPVRDGSYDVFNGGEGIDACIRFRGDRVRACEAVGRWDERGGKLICERHLGTDKGHCKLLRRDHPSGFFP